MPATAKKKSTAKKRPVKKVSPITAIRSEQVVLTNEEIANLKNRYDGWEWAKEATHKAARIDAMCQESYAAYIRELRERYNLPAQYVVDFATGLVTLPEDTSPEEASDGE